MKLETPTSADEMRAQWDASAASFDEHATPLTTTFGERLVRYADVRPGTRLLDVAAGTGAVALPAGRAGAQVVAVDLSPAMVTRLATRAGAEGLGNVDARVMDATVLDLPDRSFDICVSLNGVSTFPDVTAGLAEMARVTRPGGQVLVVAAGPPHRVEFVGYIMAALQAAVPGFEPPMDAMPPFQLADPDSLRRHLERAGLGDVRVDVVTWGMYFASASHYWEFVNGNPTGAAIAAGLTADQRADTRRVVEGMLRERSGGESQIVLDIEYNIGLGIKR